jgi:metal-responsive CopG/Arc/MetJ family transcriptional regulator
MLKTIQMTIEKELLDEVDAAIAELGVSRSAFIQDALRQALADLRVTQLEDQHALGYGQHPVQTGEFDVWQAEQYWGEP